MKTKLLLYCTLGTPKTQLINDNGKFKLCWCLKADREKLKDSIVNGTIPIECECEVEKTFYQKAQSENKLDSMLKDSCLTDEQLWNYVQNGTMKLLKLTNIKAFEKPLTIEALYQPIDNNFCKGCKEYNACEYAKSKNKPCKKVLLHAPQNMMWVWYKGQMYCLISIRPEWLCKILNGEKTIEVRRKILKGMVEEQICK